MYLNIGDDTIIKKNSVIGIFSIKNENNSQLINSLIIEDKYKINSKEYKTIILTEKKIK